MEQAFAHCEALVRAADRDRFLATLFAKRERRGALFALYAFNVEIARVREGRRAGAARPTAGGRSMPIRWHRPCARAWRATDWHRNVC